MISFLYQCLFPAITDTADFRHVLTLCNGENRVEKRNEHIVLDVVPTSFLVRPRRESEHAAFESRDLH
jgi:hypothetical protein